jgi:hypothetical protein
MNSKIEDRKDKLRRIFARLDNMEDSDGLRGAYE